MKAEIAKNNNKTESKEREMQKRLADQCKESSELVKELRTENDELRATNSFHKETIEKLFNNSLSIKNDIDQMAALKCESLQKEIDTNVVTINQLNMHISNLTAQLNAINLASTLTQLQDQLRIIDTRIEHVIQLEPRKQVGCAAPQHSTNHDAVVEVKGLKPFKVLCDSQIAGPGWTVIQQRIKGGEDFYRDWATYRNGFGSFEGDFFLGLQKIHLLTSAQRYELYIHMIDFKGAVTYARYDNFSISDEVGKYELLSLGNIQGDVADDLRWHEKMKFTTFDNDNDNWAEGNCANHRHGGWWYNNCVSR